MRFLVAALLSLVVLAAPGQAAYDGVAFTDLIDDSGDHPFGYHDFQTLSMGEPGDGTVVFRGTVGDIDMVPRDDATIMYFGFTTDAYILGGSFYDGQLVTRNVGEPILPTVCEKVVAENAIYCAWTYESIRTAPGQTISSIWGFIDSCATRTGCLPMDTGPGSIGTQGWNPASTEFSYTLTGCTLIDAAACLPSEPEVLPATVYEALMETSLVATFTNATSDTHVYNFTSDLSVASANFDVNGTGFANATLIDSNGTELFNGTAETGAIELGEVPTGDWQLLVDFTDFNGTFSFSLTEPEAEVQDEVDDVEDTTDDASEGASEDTDASGNETLDSVMDSEEAPGVALPVLALGLVAVAFARRRL